MAPGLHHNPQLSTQNDTLYAETTADDACQMKIKNTSTTSSDLTILPVGWYVHCIFMNSDLVVTKQCFCILCRQSKTF